MGIAACKHYHTPLGTSTACVGEEKGEEKCKIPKVTEMGKGVGKGRKHPEAAVRMNFLHQAAACVLKSTGNKVKLQQQSIISL